MNVNLTKDLMKSALSELDELLPTPVTLIMGGGGAMILAHHFPLGTTDIDAVPKGMTIAEIDPYVKKVAAKLEIQADWLNPYFSTFAHVLPETYGQRLCEVFKGKSLTVQALSKEDMLIMKCFAGRRKDVGHAVALIKAKADLKIVEDRIQELQNKKIPKSKEALDFLDEVIDLATP